MKEFPIMHSRKQYIGTYIAREIYKEYKAQHGDSQSFEMIATRGGFDCIEAIELLFDRIVRIEGR